MPGVSDIFDLRSVAEVLKVCQKVNEINRIYCRSCHALRCEERARGASASCPSPRHLGRGAGVHV